MTIDPLNNVALAAETQGIYRPNWTAMYRAADVRVLDRATPYLEGMERVSALLTWRTSTRRRRMLTSGRRRDLPVDFPTEYNQFDTVGCTADCSVMDGGRKSTARNASR